MWPAVQPMMAHSVRTCKGLYRSGRTNHCSTVSWPSLAPFHMARIRVLTLRHADGKTATQMSVVSHVTARPAYISATGMTPAFAGPPWSA
jgi:hypothetical protein